MADARHGFRDFAIERVPPCGSTACQGGVTESGSRALDLRCVTPSQKVPTSTSHEREARQAEGKGSGAGILADDLLVPGCGAGSGRLGQRYRSARTTLAWPAEGKRRTSKAGRVAKPAPRPQRAAAASLQRELSRSASGFVKRAFAANKNGTCACQDAMWRCSAWKVQGRSFLPHPRALRRAFPLPAPTMARAPATFVRLELPALHLEKSHVRDESPPFLGPARRHSSGGSALTTRMAL